MTIPPNIKEEIEKAILTMLSEKAVYATRDLHTPLMTFAIQFYERGRTEGVQFMTPAKATNIPADKGRMWGMKFINSEEDIIGMIEFKKQIEQILRNQLYMMSSDYAFRRNDTELMDQSDNAMKAAISATLGMLPDFNQNHKGENIMETENKVTEECVEASNSKEWI